MLVFFIIYIFCSFTALSMLLILIACDFVSMYPSHTHRQRTRLWVCHMGHQTFKIKEDSGQFHTETKHMNSRFPTSKVILPFVNIRVLLLIFLIALRLFQSRDYTFFQTTTTTATESDWLNFQPKNLS